MPALVTWSKMHCQRIQILPLAHKDSEGGVLGTVTQLHRVRAPVMTVPGSSLKRGACVPAEPPAPAHLCPSTCPDRGTCWGKGGWGDRGFCDPATLELRVGVIIVIVVQSGRVFGD